MDKENINSNQSDWLKKIKEDDLVSEDQEQSISDEDENEIEVEIKDNVDEKEEVISAEAESEKEESGEKEEQVIDQPSLVESSEHKEEPGAQIAEEKEEKPSDSEQSVSEETVSHVLTALPKNIYAHFLLINIDSPAKEIRGLPRYIPINNVKILIGRYAKAHIILDDPNNIEIKHAKLVFEDKNGNRNFYMYPINNATVYINGELLSDNGHVLKSGDLVKIGSAELIFFHYDLEEV